MLHLHSPAFFLAVTSSFQKCTSMNNVALDASSNRTAFELLEIDDVSAILHVSRSLLAKWRMHGRGPRFMKVGRRILYEAGEVRRWLEAQERSSTLG